MNPFVANPAFSVMVSATCLFAGIAAGFDLRSRRIPNPLNFTMLGLGVAFQAAVSAINDPRMQQFQNVGFKTGDASKVLTIEET